MTYQEKHEQAVFTIRRYLWIVTEVDTQAPRLLIAPVGLLFQARDALTSFPDMDYLVLKFIDSEQRHEIFRELNIPNMWLSSNTFALVSMDKGKEEVIRVFAVSSDY